MKKAPLLVFVAALFTLPAFAGTVNITVGETCAQSSGYTSCFESPSLGVILNLPFQPFFGDAQLLDADGSISDIAGWGSPFVEFTSVDEGNLAGNGNNTQFLAENPSGPTIYTATFGLPGSDVAGNTVVYHFISDEEGVKAAPEPSSLMLLGGGLVFFVRRLRS